MLLVALVVSMRALLLDPAFQSAALPKRMCGAMPAEHIIMQVEGKGAGAELAQLLGSSSAKRIMRVHGMNAKLLDGSLERAIPRLETEFSISGGGKLVTFMSDSVAARLGDESFWAALARLRDEYGISGVQLVTFMSSSVAARLFSRDFMEAVAFMCSELSPFVMVSFVKNNDPFASRLTPAFACSVVSIVRHLDAHGFAGASTLKALVGKSPLVGSIPELEAKVLKLQTHDAIEELVKSFRGSYAHKRRMALELRAVHKA